MYMLIKNTVTLHNGIEMPVLGLGVYLIDNSNANQIINTAIHNGYRSIDTAPIYGNEEGIGKGIRESGIDRKDLFITSKIWNNDSYAETFSAFNQTLQNLGLEYLDLYLIHWPGKNKFKNTWRALEELYINQKIKAIGVSNFHIHHLNDLISIANIKPMVNQVEFHPLLTQKSLIDFCKQENIQLEAWSPLMQGNLMTNNTLLQISHKYNKSVAQIILKWDLQNGVVTIPKTINEKRLLENMNIFNFELSTEDMKKIDNLNQDKRLGADPDLAVF
ncbi:TPA: aldo/keto reductase [Bacillus thuringiensis]|uniref:aldo/keto reductase n=2 Tax=Bacillus sp. CH_70 TaxID=2978215 RepID=UPI0030F581B4|nr:aldo/keto reductase [Bacillus thuringiensis]